MILAHKITKLRKKNGWSQEDFAERMNVSRQAVSKWESGQTVPDLEKILQISLLFGVTTDYLLKDEIEDEQLPDVPSEGNIRRIASQEVLTYIAQRKRASFQIASATFLCILSPITLFILSAVSEEPFSFISEVIASVIGLAVLFAFVLCAIPIFIYCGFKNEPYAFLENNVAFELAYDARALVSEQKKNFRDTYVKGNIIASCICVFSPIPLILTAFANHELLSVAMLAVMMILVGIGVFIFILVGVQNASMEKLLQEGEFTKEEKESNRLKEAVGFLYWCVLTAIYLIWSFLTNCWYVSWVIFAVGALLFPACMCLCEMLGHKKHKK